MNKKGWMYCSKYFSGLTPQSLKFKEVIIDINKYFKIRFLPHRKPIERNFEGSIFVFVWEWYETHKYDVWDK